MLILKKEYRPLQQQKMLIVNDYHKIHDSRHEAKQTEAVMLTMPVNKTRKSVLNARV
jgi:hypothetical protein